MSMFIPLHAVTSPISHRPGVVGWLSGLTGRGGEKLAGMGLSTWKRFV
jgi:hypothetical protein